VPLLTEANKAVTEYVNAATAAGASVPGTVVNVAGRQRMLSQRMSKEALLVALNVDATTTRATLQSTLDLFSTSHTGLLEGSTSLGLPGTTNACILQQMKTVTDLYGQMGPILSNISNGTTPTKAMLNQIVSLNPTLLTEMNVAVGLYASSSPTCTAASVTSTEWSTVINVAGRQRMLSQKMSKEFLLVAWNYEVATSKTNMAATIAEFDTAFGKLMYGSTSSSIPAPPTQGVADQLVVVKGLWTSFKVLLENNVNNTGNTTILAAVATDSVPLLTEANKAVTEYVNAATAAGASVPGTVVNVAGRQRMLSQRMSKEALLVALNVDATTTRATLQSTLDLFSTSHTGLLEGSTSLGLPGTTNACILQQMKTVTDLYGQMGPILSNISNGTTPTKAMLNQIVSLNPTLLTEMNRAVTLYAAGGCIADHSPHSPVSPSPIVRPSPIDLNFTESSGAPRPRPGFIALALIALHVAWATQVLMC